jgi:hypothetical protein
MNPIPRLKPYAGPALFSYDLLIELLLQRRDSHEDLACQEARISRTRSHRIAARALSFIEPMAR